MQIYTCEPRFLLRSHTCNHDVTMEATHPTILLDLLAPMFQFLFLSPLTQRIPSPPFTQKAHLLRWRPLLKRRPIFLASHFSSVVGPKHLPGLTAADPAPFGASSHHRLFRLTSRLLLRSTNISLLRSPHSPGICHHKSCISHVFFQKGSFCQSSSMCNRHRSLGGDSGRNRRH